MVKTCPECGCYINWKGLCGCGEGKPIVTPEIKRRRKVVDRIQKDMTVAEKVAIFLGID